MNVKVPDYLQRWLRSEASLVGLGVAEYVSRALRAQIDQDRAERESEGGNDKARRERARAEAADALAERDD